jgi:hypothetical protein
MTGWLLPSLIVAQSQPLHATTCMNKRSPAPAATAFLLPQMMLFTVSIWPRKLSGKHEETKHKSTKKECRKRTTCRHAHEHIVTFQSPLFHPPLYRGAVETTASVDAGDADAQWLVVVSRRRSHAIKSFDQLRSSVPVAFGRGAAAKIMTDEPAHGHKHCVDVAGCYEERLHRGDDLIVALFVPSALVHLIDRDNKLPDAKRLQQQRMLSGLAPARESGFELTNASVNDEHRSVCAAGASNHVWYEVLVPRSIENCHLLKVNVCVLVVERLQGWSPVG